MEDRGRPWKTVEDRGRPWKTVEDRGRPWKTVEDRGRTRKTVEDYGRLLKTVDDRGRPWKTVEDCGRPWKTELNEIRCRIDRRRARFANTGHSIHGEHDPGPCFRLFTFTMMQVFLDTVVYTISLTQIQTFSSEFNRHLKSTMHA